jgi:hypothetical protein
MDPRKDTPPHGLLDWWLVVIEKSNFDTFKPASPGKLIGVGLQGPGPVTQQ